MNVVAAGAFLVDTIDYARKKFIAMALAWRQL
jgi:hypothetical protein